MALLSAGGLAVAECYVAPSEHRLVTEIVRRPEPSRNQTKPRRAGAVLRTPRGPAACSNRRTPTHVHAL